MTFPLSRELAYLGRHAWVSFKETAGLSRRNDRTFYVDRFVRALQAGTLPRTYGILATGKDDGAGSQAQAAMSAICLAEAFGLTYIHRPFTVIEHTEGGMSDWIRQWEDYFNLGCGARRLSQCSSPVVPLDELLMAPEKWPDTAIVAAPHYLRFCNQDPQGWERALPRLRTKFHQNKQPQSRDAFTIALHVRRGDVTTDDKKHAGRFTPNAAFIRTLESIMTAVSTDVSGNVRIKLFSQGDPAIFADFARAGCELHLDNPRSRRTASWSMPTFSSCRKAPSATPQACSTKGSRSTIRTNTARSRTGSCARPTAASTRSSSASASRALLARKNLEALRALTSIEQEPSVSRSA